MTTITKYVVALMVCLFVGQINAQETNIKENDSIIKNENTFKEDQIKKLKEQKTRVETQERNLLKAEIEIINAKLDAGKITAGEAEKLKKEAAKKHAANIEDRLAIIDKKIEIVRRNPYNRNGVSVDNDKVEISFGSNGLYIDLQKDANKTPPKYDIRTSNKLLFAIGFNNAIGDGQGLDDSPYKLGGSGFVELGWIWQTRLSKNSNFARINYGFAFQWNKFKVKDNQYFVQNGDQTTLQTFPFDLKKSKFRTTNLVFPVHFEFGPSRKKDYGNRVRYFTDNKFKVGVGGFGGVRLRAQQKLVYDDADGNRVKSKEKRNFNGSNFVYGVSGYIGYGDISLYAKYDLSPVFKNQTTDQNNISLGLRWAWD